MEDLLSSRGRQFMGEKKGSYEGFPSSGGSELLPQLIPFCGTYPSCGTESLQQSTKSRMCF